MRKPGVLLPDGHVEGSNPELNPLSRHDIQKTFNRLLSFSSRSAPNHLGTHEREMSIPDGIGNQGMYWLDNLEERGLQVPTQPRFHIDRSRTIDVLNSAHKVFIGKLAGTGNTESDEEAPIAVKHFTRSSAAMAELNNTREYAARTSTKTFEYLGVLVSEKDEAFLMSLYADSVRSLDSIGDWQDYIRGKRQEEIESRLVDVGTHIAETHSTGLTHGDLQIKNVATDTRGRVRLIDFEDLQQCDVNYDANTLAERSIADLTLLFQSLRRPRTTNEDQKEMGVGLYTMFDHPVAANHFDTFVLKPYTDTLAINLAKQVDEDKAVEIASYVEERTSDQVANYLGLHALAA